MLQISKGFEAKLKSVTPHCGHEVLVQNVTREDAIALLLALSVVVCSSH